MGKNIVLCSDGTGNSGANWCTTNVFHLYKAVDIQSSNQIAFYDNGIGSSGSKYIRIVAGAFGFGFEKNIINLYGYLVRHYVPGDKIFMFGFSRGAATMRAVAGMIEAIGLMRSDHESVLTDGRVDDVKMAVELMKALRIYKKAKRKSAKAEEFKRTKTYGAVDIELIGVWDTVSALGFPQDSSWLVIGLSKAIDMLSEKLFPHRFFDYQLGGNVKNAYHALALDDERKTFHPVIWDEVSDKRPLNIEQVWFAGAHSNVGGGYPRTGLSNIPLDWMMTKANKHGLAFNPNLWGDVKDGMNPSGNLNDSRGGLGIYFRFSPRHVRDLCIRDGKSILSGDIKIHASVFDRIVLRKYAPILPNKFDIVWTDLKREPLPYEVKVDEVKRLKKRANLLITCRIWLYHILTEMSVVAGFLIWYLSSYRFTQTSDSRIYNFVKSVLPSILENFLYFFTYEHRVIGIILALSFIGAIVAHKIAKVLTDRTRKRINWWLFNDLLE